MITVLAWIGAFAVTVWVLAFAGGLCALWRESRRETAEMERAMGRHPAGGCWWTEPSPLLDPVGPGEDGTPFSARTVCGHFIYGDSLGDLLANEAYHFSSCQLPNRKDEVA